MSPGTKISQLRKIEASKKYGRVEFHLERREFQWCCCNCCGTLHTQTHVIIYLHIHVRVSTNTGRELNTERLGRDKSPFENLRLKDEFRSAPID